MTKYRVLFLSLVCSSAAALGQAVSTASRAGDLQIGGGYSIAGSDYTVNKIRGFAFYSDFDFKSHYGIEVDFHQLNDPRSTQIYERTYEVGGRYLRHYGPATPYVKGLYGRGVFNFPQSQANLAYNMLVAGAGVDFAVHPRVNVRIDWEYQHWFSFPPHGLAPKVLTIGAAYHFPPGYRAH